MKKLTILLLMSIILLSITGCSSRKQARTGFLSDYSKLKEESSDLYLYLSPMYGQGKYKKIIVDPVKPYFHDASKAKEEEAEGKIKKEDVEDLMDYAHAAIIREVADLVQVVANPGPDTLRLRIAITDLMRSKIGQNIVPHTKIAGTGLGGASMEAELVDSVTGKQVAAVVQTQKGTRWALNNATTWGDARNVIDEWAKRLRKRVEGSLTQ